MIKDIAISTKAAKRWVSYHAFMPREHLRAKWDDYTSEAEQVTPHEPIDGATYWRAHGYVFMVTGNEIADVFPWRPHLYK